MTDEVRRISRDGIEWLVDPKEHGDFWDKMESGTWEPELYEKMRQLIKPDTVFLDIGGWIGPTSFYGAQLAKETYTFEPNPSVFAELKESLSLNHHDWAKRVTLFNEAAGMTESIGFIGCMNDNDDSTGSLLFTKREGAFQIKIIDISKFIKSHKIEEENIFIKMDIEGAEFDVIPYISRYLKRKNFAVFLSLHPQFLYKKFAGNNPRVDVFSRLMRRIKVALAYRKIYSSFGDRTITDINGSNIEKEKNLFYMILFAKFPADIVIP